MAAETLGMPFSSIHVVSTQDTDLAFVRAYVPPDVCRVKRSWASQKLGRSSYAGNRRATPEKLTSGTATWCSPAPDKVVMNLKDLAMDAYYHKDREASSRAKSYKTRTNAPSFGCTFVDLEVDLPLCRVKIHEIYNVHDCGVVINPLLAEGQVHGGMAMSIGAGLFEVLMIDPESGTIQNINLLDYKIPTIMDIPDLSAGFVETNEPTHPYGSKSLGEPPIYPARLSERHTDATGVAINELPQSQGSLYHFSQAGLI
jgi:xanthine dehydrogenase molybdenum-binding subunit